MRVCVCDGERERGGGWVCVCLPLYTFKVNRGSETTKVCCLTPKKKVFEKHTVGACVLFHVNRLLCTINVGLAPWLEEACAETDPQLL